MTHIVWDWNGTLFDDIHAVVEATNAVFLPYGLGSIDVDGFRTTYTRPIWVMYERFLGRSLAEGEWERLDQAFHESYHRIMDRYGLAADALDTLAAATAAGHSQSLLSMWQHDRLVTKVSQLQLTGTFRRVDGLGDTDDPGGGKARFLVRHLAALGVRPEDVVMIGDSADDAAAAAGAGVRAVAYTGGMQSRTDLQRLGVPVVDTLSALLPHL
jgi:phosphoglycolate phosphatase-like HAD superfamily hydrolase